MSLSSRNWFRGLAATSAAVVFAVAGGAAALADTVQDDVVVGVNSSVAVGGTTTVKFSVSPNSGDGVGGCNFNSAGDSMSATLSLAGSGTATPSTTTVVFTDCGLDVPVDFTGVTTGTVNGELTQLANNTGGSFNFNPAKFTLTVTTPTKAPTTTTVSCPATPQTYTGAGLTPCTATATATGGFTQSVPVTYTNNTNVGSATADATFAGDATHLGSSGSATFAIAKASSTTTVSCPTSTTWTGSPQMPCSAGVTGAGGLDQALTPTYSGNTAVGTATASANYAGDANHDGSTGSSTFEITKAAATVKVTCSGAPFIYTGSAQEPCTATVTGAGGLAQSLTVDYSGNDDAGTATASASFAGDAGHESATGSATFDIGQAAATCTVTGFDGTYDGTPHALTATCTGLNGADLSTGFDAGESFTDAGAHTAHWTFEGGTNYADQSGTGTVSIAKADSRTVVSCTASVTYDGSAHEPCTAKVTGVGGLDQALTPTYVDNTNAGTATASAMFSGDDNHFGSHGSATFEIEKAATFTTVTCPAGPFVYTGSPITPACTASTTGAGGLTASPAVSFTHNTNSGDATASATYAGDANHTGSTGSTTFVIDKAPSKVTLLCTSPVSYTGSPIEACSATATGAGIVTPIALVVGYTSNTDAGTAHASAAWDGDANHESSSDATTFTINRAATVTTVTCPASVNYTGSPITPCTAAVTGPGGLDHGLTVSYLNNVGVGTATASASYAGTDNYEPSSGSSTFHVASWWTLRGFYQPVDMNGVVNAVKAGSTVPLKFEVFAGSTELTSTSAVKSFTESKIACDTGSQIDDIELTTTGGTSLRYDTTGGQFVQNWQTPKTAGVCYKVTVTTQDLTTISALFRLK